MSSIIIYTKANCSYCDMAKKLFASKNISYSEIRIDLDESKKEEMIRLSQHRTVPQIFINQQNIGGYDDLVNLIRSGQFEQLINNQ